MKTHYDVLNLHKTCSSKEIKDSFIKLSKLYHPDKNKSKDAHKKFVEVNEAYSVLGKPETRSQYDHSLMFARTSAPFRPGPSASPVTRTTYEQYAQMYANNLRKGQESTGYITDRKIKAFFFCCFLAIIGSGIQMKAILNRKSRQDQELLKYLKEARDRKRKRKEEMLKQREAALVESPDLGN